MKTSKDLKLLKKAKVESNRVDIIYGEKCLDDKTAEDILKRSRELRKSFKMGTCQDHT